MTYNWKRKDWPDFRYDLVALEDMLFSFARKMGRVEGMLQPLPEKVRTETVMESMISEAIKTSEIEGEVLTRADVMSSIQKNLGVSPHDPQARNQRAEGIAELMMAIRKELHHPLSQPLLFSWHTMLMKGTRQITRGQWRAYPEPMRIVSGPVGSEKIHFEAPPSVQVPAEMKRFIHWFNASAPGGACEIKHASVRSAIAHLYFESIHPFEDGNGRIGRALSKKALFQGIGHAVPLSLSRTIEAHKSQYYAALQAGQRSNEITPWIAYFIQMLLTAQEQAENLIHFTAGKARLFDRLGSQLNPRQTQMLRCMLKAGPDGFEGGMSAGKYMSITGTSKATATRDLQELVDMRVLLPSGGGRSIRYQIQL